MLLAGLAGARFEGIRWLVIRQAGVAGLLVKTIGWLEGRVGAGTFASRLPVSSSRTTIIQVFETLDPGDSTGGGSSGPQ
jgi:hypothetical protein